MMWIQADRAAGLMQSVRAGEVSVSGGMIRPRPFNPA